MNALKTFKHDDFGKVRVVERDGELWFIAKDVAEALGYAESSNAARLLANIPDEWKGVNRIHTPGGTQEMLCLSEQGLYFFLGRSDKPAALPFQKWLAGEVLPAIRKYGGYLTPGKQREVLDNPDMLYRMAEALLNERDKRQIAEEKLLYLKPNVQFGTPSETTGAPRNHLVKPYWRSMRITVTAEPIIEWQRSLFE